MAKRGFTIIELVVAIIIAAIISGAVASSLSQLGRARDISRIRMTASRRATDALESIRRDVQSTLRSDDLFDTRLRLSPEVARLSSGEVDRDQMLLFALRLSIQAKARNTKRNIALKRTALAPRFGDAATPCPMNLRTPAASQNLLVTA